MSPALILKYILIVVVIVMAFVLALKLIDVLAGAV